MMSIGLILILFGYATLYWGFQAIQGKSQPSYVTYILPFAK